MDTRRDFIKKATLLSGGAGLLNVLPASIAKAIAIDPAAGSTFYDAEHVVLLMQENRSFDHTYGTLQGVRGFNDPRSITLPGNKPVWCQPNQAGEMYAPFRLDIHKTNATWMESLPHSWTDQVDARNEGRYDKWLDNKHSGVEDYRNMPLTLGFYTREDIPFYYSLADAFTVCDQHFCSSLTGTTANRLYFWTGTIREKPVAASEAKVWNDDADYDSPVSWKTFPERLEENDISWKVYQNEIGAGSELKEEHDQWLGNFGDNPLEYFSQYNVNKKSEDLSGAEKNIHEKAFTTNKNDPDYHELTALKYHDGQQERVVNVPKGDVLHQFRDDVKNGKLPTVSWLVAPQKFSDHPSSAWYGAWYISEVMDILTQNPEVWKKTIFILTYDENDGYFDHVPPFTAPHPHNNSTGAVSNGIDTSTEYVTDESQQSSKGKDARMSPIGLGYRVPMVVASPWTRGGWVNSQVFDHTSSLQFLEQFLSHKTKKKIRETNISDWRRTVCGDLTSVFRKYNNEDITKPAFLERNEFIEAIHKAQFKNPPSNFKKIADAELENIRAGRADILAQQEKGTRSANALPYELYADGKMSSDKKSFVISLQAANKIHGAKSVGAPFNIYAEGFDGEEVKTWSYAVKAGDVINAAFPLDKFGEKGYCLKVYGPNGFFREFRGVDEIVDVRCSFYKGVVRIMVKNEGSRPVTFAVTDNAYGGAPVNLAVEPMKSGSAFIEVKRSFGWYDVSVKSGSFAQTFAGRVEDGKTGRTDPLMGREVQSS